MSDDNKEVDLNKMLNSESQNNDIEKEKTKHRLDKKIIY